MKIIFKSTIEFSGYKKKKKKKIASLLNEQFLHKENQQFRMKMNEGRHDVILKIMHNVENTVREFSLLSRILKMWVIQWN